MNLSATTFATFEQYRPLALRTEAPLPTTIARLDHAALGLITETGEVVTVAKRIVIYGKSLDDTNKDDGKTLRQNLFEEIGDVCWYLAIADDALQGSLFSHHFKKLVPLRRELVTPIQRLDRASLSLAAATGRIASIVLQLQRFPTTLGTSEVRDLTGSMNSIAQNLVDLCDIAGLNLIDIMNDNIAKLRKRFPNAYSAEAAEARADKGGLSALNS